MKKPKLIKLKWGVAGGGRITESRFIPTMKVLKRSSLTAVYSSSAERAKFLAAECVNAHPYSDFDEFINQDFNAVYIAGSNDTHYEQALKAAKAGKHILCEKPVALTAEQAEEMYDTCKANNVLYGVNFIFRYHPLIKKSKELIASQLIGKVISINTDFFIDFPPTDNYRFSPEKGGGALRDLASHLIDLQRYYGGEIEEIYGEKGNVVFKSQVDDFSTGIIKFKNGGFGKFSVGFNAKVAPNRIEVIGSKGSICIEKLLGSEKPAKLVINVDGEPRRVFRRRTNKFLKMMRSVQRSFIGGKEPLATGYDGMINMRLIEEFEKKCNR